MQGSGIGRGGGITSPNLVWTLVPAERADPKRRSSPTGKSANQDINESTNQDVRLQTRICVCEPGYTSANQDIRKVGCGSVSGGVK